MPILRIIVIARLVLLCLKQQSLSISSNAEFESLGTLLPKLGKQVQEKWEAGKDLADFPLSVCLVKRSPAETRAAIAKATFGSWRTKNGALVLEFNSDDRHSARRLGNQATEKLIEKTINQLKEKVATLKPVTEENLIKTENASLERHKKYLDRFEKDLSKADGPVNAQIVSKVAES